MGEDELRTLDALRQLRTELFEPVVSSYNGTVVKRMGDGWIVEFSSVSDAVNCALRVHEGLVDHEIIRLRTGIHIGDVVFEEEDVFGDGVNIAARLEELAQPGEVLISDAAYQSIDGKAAARFGDGNRHQLKNIARPVQVWRWPADAAATAASITVDEKVMPALPDKPSIAVLPFQNMSGDAEQEFFADGMAEDIITALSRHRSLFVIAHNSSFAYKGQSPDLRQVAAELGVRYVLEGSVRKGGDRVRITAQLIDGATGNHIWAERYDRMLDDIFSVQDEMTQEITARIGPEIDQAERDRARLMPPENLDVWESYQRGLWHLYRFNAEDNAEAQRLFLRAIGASGTFAPAHSGLTHARYYAFMHGHAEDRQATLDEAYASGRAAVSADDRDADTHFALGRILYLRHESAASVKEFETAVAQNPNFAHAHLGLAGGLLFDGQGERCIEACEQAVRLSPHDPLMWTILTTKALGLVVLERHPEAVVASREAVRQPTAPWTAYGALAIASGLAGNTIEGAGALADVRRVKHDFSIHDVRQVFPFREPVHINRMIEGLRLSGLED